MPVHIAATGSYLPELVVSNDDLAKFLDTSDEWITTRTGIKTRHIARDETTTEMGAKAASIALRDSGLAPEDIQLVVCATLTPDTAVPMVAANIKKELGIPSAPAFDLNGNCTGFVYALAVAEGLMKSCGYQHALVIGSDTNSQLLDWSDRSTCVLFGDGAGAVVLSTTDRKGIISRDLGCIIDSEGALTCHRRLDKTPFSDRERITDTKIKMQGNKVLRFSVKAFSTSLEKVMEQSPFSMHDLKYIVPHQANLRIIEAAASNVGLDRSKFYINIDRVANTSSGTIAIALDEMARGDLVSRGDVILLAAFGGGLSYGAMLLEW
jgi:3-oxoacyl-[acyl-carrier-protein] synthase-3